MRGVSRLLKASMRILVPQQSWALSEPWELQMSKDAPPSVLRFQAETTGNTAMVLSNDVALPLGMVQKLYLGLEDARGFDPAPL